PCDHAAAGLARYSYAAAGLALGAMQLASAASNPVRDRLVTGHSLRTVLMGCLVGYLMGLGGLAAAVRPICRCPHSSWPPY
ncbi:hypothetical protein, partial [Streptomyces rubiginosohelvolus]